MCPGFIFFVDICSYYGTVSMNMKVLGLLFT